MNFSRSPSLPSRSLPSGGVMLLVLLALAALLLVPGMAHAADLFTVPAGDKSKTLFLDKIFGDFSNSPLAGPVSVFNSAILFVGGILAAYTIIAGTMSTAHDGEMLGKKWSSMWVPVRTAIGTAAILPVLNGFCVAQAIVLWLATQGIGLADAVWNQFASSPIQTMSVTTAGMGDKVTTMALAMLRSNVCLQAEQNANSAQASNNGGYSFGTLSYEVSQFTSSTETGYTYGMTSGSTVDGGAGAEALCGSVSLNTSAQTAVTTTGIASADALSQGVDANSTAISNAHKSALPVLQAAMAKAAQQFLANPTSFDVLGAVQTAATQYEQTVANAANTAINDPNLLSQFRQDVQADGWAFAGAWYMKLIRMQDAVNGAVNRTPSISGPSSESLFSNDVSASMTKLDNVIKRDAPKQSSGLARAALTDMNNLDTESDCSGLSCVGSFFKKVGKMFSTAGSAATNPENLITGSMGSLLDSATDLNDTSKNGLLAAKALGDNIIMAGWAVAILGSLLAMTLAGIGAALVPLSFAFMLWTVGAGLSVVLPMTPFIMWVGIMIGWLILVVEAVYAAPLWAVVHLHPDGDGVVGRGGTGYMLVLSLTLRPSLMILGLISAIVLMDPITYFLNATFFGAFRLMQGNSTTGAVTFVAVTAMYCSAMFMVIRKTFSLIHVIPDQIMNWIGNGGPSLGGSATAAAEQAASGHKGIIAGVGQAAASGMGAATRVRSIQAQREGNASQRRAADEQARGNRQDAKKNYDEEKDRAQTMLMEASVERAAVDAMPDPDQDAAFAQANAMPDGPEKDQALKDAANHISPEREARYHAIANKEERAYAISDRADRDALAAGIGDDPDVQARFGRPTARSLRTPFNPETVSQARASARRNTEDAKRDADDAP